MIVAPTATEMLLRRQTPTEIRVANIADRYVARDVPINFMSIDAPQAAVFVVFRNKWARNRLTIGMRPLEIRN